MTNIDNPHLWGGKKYFSTLFARIFLWLTIGILIAEYTQLSYLYFLIVTTISALLIIFSTLRATSLGEWIFVFAFPLTLMSLGGTLATTKNCNNFAIEEKEEYQILVADVVSVPIKKTKYFKTEAIVRYVHKEDSLQKIVAQALEEPERADRTEGKKMIGAGLCTGARVVLNFEADSTSEIQPQIGDRYLVSTRVSLPKPLFEESFDYGRYLRHHGFAGTGWVSSDRCELISENHIEGVRMKMLKLRNKMIDRYKSIGINGVDLSILSAITLGEKGMLSDDTKSYFTATGVSHVLVVSGMHVGFIYLIIIFLMKRARGKVGRILCVTSGLIVLWFYALLSGFAPSIVRATFMFTMMLILRVKGNSYRVENALFLSAIILILINPFVIFDVGFQLSYTAVISIVYFTPYFSKAIRKLKLYKTRPKRVVEALLMTISVTLSAQILTTPIVLFNFHQFPIYFVITNMIVSMLAPVIFIGGLALIPLSFVPYVGVACGTVMSYVLSVLEWTVEYVSDFPMAVVSEYVSAVECILLYVVILAAVNLMETYQFYAARFGAIVFLLLSIVTLMMTMTYNDWIYRDKEEMIIFGGGGTTVNLISANENIVFSQADKEFVTSRLKPIWLKFNCPDPVFVSDSSLAANSFVYKGEKFMIMRGNRFRHKKNPPASLQVDCIIIDKGIYPSERLFDEFVDTRKVILTQSVWHGYHEQYKDLTTKREIELEILD